MSLDYAIKLESISKSYMDGNQVYPVLTGVNLKVAAGEFVAIVGPSGSGKSTVLSIAGALLDPNDGEIIVGNDRLMAMNHHEMTQIRREQIGFIFQSHHLLPFLTSIEQLELMHQISKKKDKMRATELIQEMGLEACTNKYPAQMSGGEKQRVAIARAFMNDPKIILADEPTASLDASRGRQVVERIASAVKKYKKAAIMVTHDERVLDLVDRIYHLENGRLVPQE